MAPSLQSDISLELRDFAKYISSHTISYDVCSSSTDVSSSRVFVCLSTNKGSTNGPKFLFDTGASVSLMTPADFRHFRRLGLVRSKLNCTPNIVNASGAPMAHDGVFDIKFYYQGKPCHGAFVVSPALQTHSILGMNVIRQYGLTLDPIANTVQRCTAPDLAVSAVGAQESKLLVQVANTTSVDPGTSARVRCRLVRAHNHEPVRQHLQFLADIDALTVAMVTSEAGTFSPHLPNADVVGRTFHRGDIIGHAYGLADVNFISDHAAVSSVSASTPKPRAHTPEERRSIRLRLQERLDHSGVPYAVRADYMAMLDKYDDVFSADSLDLGLTNVISHGIQLRDDDPQYKGQFRLAQEQMQLIKDNVVGWLRAGLIQRSNSKFNSPVFCVPKKEGKGLRVVLDYRLLNDKSVPDKYSIRTIDQCLEEIGRAGSKLFTCLDLTNGFWQLNLAEEARPFTAFTIPGVGQFEWLVTPQGLMGAPASFSRLMDLIMSDAENIITYIDDVLVHSASHAEHIRHVGVALQRLRLAHLRLNPGKCIFAATSVQYLGHTISAAGVQPGKSKTDAITSCQPPSTAKQLKSFLGLANYFRQFIHDFAKRAAPLFHLTRKEVDWKSGNPMTPRALAAFEDLKAAITSRPLLAYPTAHLRFTLTVDAAQGDATNLGGMGACLLQKQDDGSIRPVGYASRQLYKYEANYPPFLLEMAAAVFGMEYFHHYLVGRRFTLLTDHKPLERISVTHTKTLNRLQLKMQEMHPDVGYLKGGFNTISDFLSRYKGMNAAASGLTSDAGINVSAIELTPACFRPRQPADPWCRELIDLLGPKPYRPDGYFCGKNRVHLKLRPDGCLMARPPTRQGFIDTGDWLAVVPASLRKDILLEAHNSRIAGHGGSFRTMERLREKVWWPNMEEDVRRHISECEVCGACPASTAPTPQPPQRLPQCVRPNQRVHVDLSGPHSKSDHGNEWILVYTDAFTRLTRLTPLPDKSAKTVSSAILQWIYLYGVPDQIHSDQGREFCNELAQHLYSALDIEHTTTTPYHPQCNAAAERFNRTMNTFIARAIKEAGRSTLDWELFLGPLMLSYNSGVNKSTRMSPYYATFGLNPKLPLWTGGFGDDEAAVQNDDYAAHLARLHRAQATAQKVVFANEQHDRQRTAPPAGVFPDFPTHARVWLKVDAKNDPNPKFSPNGEPGVVLKRTSESTYKVLRYNRRRRKQVTVNISKIRARNTPLPDDDRFPLDLPPPEPRRSARLTTKTAPDYSDGDADDVAALELQSSIMASVNAVATTAQIKHLLPPEAHHLPLLEALSYLHHERVTSQDLVDLLLQGWILGAASSAPPPARAPSPSPERPPPPRRQLRPTISRALARLLPHNAPGRAEERGASPPVAPSPSGSSRRSASSSRGSTTPRTANTPSASATPSSSNNPFKRLSNRLDPALISRSNITGVFRHLRSFALDNGLQLISDDPHYLLHLPAILASTTLGFSIVTHFHGGHPTR